jgi:putative SOS response-associated peptidase YedK
MCYNLQFLQRRIEKYADRYREVLPADWDIRTFRQEIPEYYFVSGFSHPLLPVIRTDGIIPCEWGLIPFWVKDAGVAGDLRGKTLNAVGETVFSKPAFRNSVSSQRCLLGINGFFEWREFNKAKYPYFIKSRSRDIFSLGCLSERWIDKSTGEIRNTFSIITTPANLLMEQIHNTKKRMPLILGPGQEKNWIDPRLPKEQVAALIKPYSGDDLYAFTISRAANSPRNERNVPGICDRVDYPELPALN